MTGEDHARQIASETIGKEAWEIPQGEAANEEGEAR
jgi:hypothetical protein